MKPRRATGVQRRYDVTARVPHPLAAVYPVYRDHFDEVARELANIRNVELFDREVSGERVNIRHHWHARVGIPLIARKHVRPDMLGFAARVQWTNGTTDCSYVITPDYFAEYGECDGKVELRADGDETVVRMHGRLDIDLKEFPFIPKRFRGTVARGAASFMLTRVPANFAGVAGAVTKYLEAKPAAPAVRSEPRPSTGSGQAPNARESKGSVARRA